MKRQAIDSVILSLLLLTVAMLTACTMTIPDAGTVTVERDNTVALNQRQLLAMQLGLELTTVNIEEVELVTWPDACLGKPDPAELCASAETPGYRIRLKANGEEYVYHANEEGSNIRLAVAPEPAIGQQFLSWMHTNADGICQEARFGVDGIAFGRCGGLQMGVPYVHDEWEVALNGFVAEFAPFEAETPVGVITFTGSGRQEAISAQQRMIAEWANLIHLEAQIGRSGASWGLAFAWHREGGIAGFCDDIAAYMTGTVYVISCRGQQPQDLMHFRLNADQLTTMYGWIDTYAPFEYSWTDSAQADGMNVVLVFSGAGETEATMPEQLLIVDFAQNLFNEGSMASDGVPSACAPPDEARQMLIQAKHSYCLLYPTEYSLWQQSPDSMEIISVTVMNHIDPRVSITVEAAKDRTLTEVVEELMANFVPPGFYVEPQPLTVDDVEATMLDEVPGQDLSRHVVMIHNGWLYTLLFSFIGDAGTERRQHAERLYEIVIDSFHLLDRAE